MTKKKIIWTGAAMGVALVLGGAGMALSSNSEKLEEYEDVLALTGDAHQEAQDTLQSALALEPELQEQLKGLVSDATALMTAESPSVVSFGIDDRINELSEVRGHLVENQTELRNAIAERDDHIARVREAKVTVKEAQQLLKDTKGKVTENKRHESLSNHVTAMEDTLKSEPDDTSASSYTASSDAIEEISSDISEASDLVSESHQDWKDEEEAKAQRDPSNYKSISQRDWQLIERKPDDHKGEKYVLYGAVTQADAAMGEVSIRVNTNPVKQSRRYNYEINTVALVGTAGVFSDVVQGDHVKMLVEVSGSMTYDTTIGGSATAVMVLAYDAEVIGQF